MRRNLTLVLSLFALLSGTLIFSGSSGGVALVQKLDRTGSPLSNNFYCSACHLAGQFNPQVHLEVLSGDMPVTTYVPGQTYTVRVVVDASPNASVFGFQAVALSGPGHVQAGIFQNPPTGVAIRTVNNRSYAEHQFPSLKDTFQLSWVAPPANTGQVRLYAAGIAANANGSDSGDGASRDSLFLQEDGASDVMVPSAASMSVMYDGSSLLVQLPLAEGALELWTLAGQPVWQHPVPAPGFLRLTAPQPGLYLLSWLTDQGRTTRKIFLPGH